ncbi:TPA: hypothetical protein DDW35_04145, partial [Candidatus Sumerlaeota bacterium]|nr:hypothetical protein [Candidatus Sumerlaeota bacterium]
MEKMKKVSLTAKVFSGFGVILLILVITNVTNWQGITKIYSVVDLQDNGLECLERLNNCATLRRDFQLYGNEKVGNATKNAGDSWQDEHKALKNSLEVLEKEPALPEAVRPAVKDALGRTDEYKKAFDTLVTANNMCDEASATWGKSGQAI